MMKIRTLTTWKASTLKEIAVGFRRKATSASGALNSIDSARNAVTTNDHDSIKRHPDRIFYSGISLLKGDIEQLKSNVKNRGVDINVDELVHLYQEYKSMTNDIKRLREQKNKNAKEAEAALTDRIRMKELSLKGRKLKDEISKLEADQLNMKGRLFRSLVHLPNHTHPDVPVGDESKARVVRINGRKPEFDFQISDHVEIGEKHDIIDFKAAAMTSGRSFYYLKGVGAQLEMALIHYSMNKAIAKGFHPIITPDVVNIDVLECCGFQPKGDCAHVYELNADHHGYKCLAGTAEIPLAGMLINQVIPEKDLPLRFVAFGRCYRAETGHGKTNKGLYRVHQFSKVEMFGVTGDGTGTESEELLQEILDIQQEINSELGFHYKLLEMPTGDLGIPAYHKYDIEVWMPGMNTYGEVTSASNCTDFQARRLGIKYGTHKGFAHTVNGTACAVPRTLVALLENYQNQDGSVSLPTVLQPYIGGRSVLGF